MKHYPEKYSMGLFNKLYNIAAYLIPEMLNLELMNDFSDICCKVGSDTHDIHICDYDDRFLLGVHPNLFSSTLGYLCTIEV